MILNPLTNRMVNRNGNLGKAIEATYKKCVVDSKPIITTQAPKKRKQKKPPAPKPKRIPSPRSASMKSSPVLRTIKPEEYRPRKKMPVLKNKRFHERVVSAERKYGPRHPTDTYEYGRIKKNIKKNRLNINPDKVPVLRNVISRPTDDNGQKIRVILSGIQKPDWYTQ